VSLADLDHARARDKRTGHTLTDFFLEEMLADPMIRLVMQADGVSEAHLRHLYTRPELPQVDDRQTGQVAPSKPAKIGHGMDAGIPSPLFENPRRGIGE